MQRSWLAHGETVNNEFTLDVSCSCLPRGKLWKIKKYMRNHWQFMLKAPQAPGLNEHRLDESIFHTPKRQSQVRLVLSGTV